MSIRNVERINEDLKSILLRRYKGFLDDAEVLEDIRVRHCRQADIEHHRDHRYYAHAGHEEGIICVSSSLDLIDNENIYGVLAHEYGHIIHDQFPELIVEAEDYPGEFEIEIDLEYGIQIVQGVHIDNEIFADWIMQKLFDLRIWYDEKKVQWFTPKWINSA